MKHSTFWSHKHFTHHNEQLEWSHDRVLINSKFNFLPENVLFFCTNFNVMYDIFNILTSIVTRNRKSKISRALYLFQRCRGFMKLLARVLRVGKNSNSRYNHVSYSLKASLLRNH